MLLRNVTLVGLLLGSLTTPVFAQEKPAEEKQQKEDILETDGYLTDYIQEILSHHPFLHDEDIYRVNGRDRFLCINRLPAVIRDEIKDVIKYYSRPSTVPDIKETDPQKRAIIKHIGDLLSSEDVAKRGQYAILREAVPDSVLQENAVSILTNRPYLFDYYFKERHIHVSDKELTKIVEELVQNKMLDYALLFEDQLRSPDPQELIFLADTVTNPQNRDSIISQNNAYQKDVIVETALHCYNKAGYVYSNDKLAEVIDVLVWGHHRNNLPAFIIERYAALNLPRDERSDVLVEYFYWPMSINRPRIRTILDSFALYEIRPSRECIIRLGEKFLDEDFTLENVEAITDLTGHEYTKRAYLECADRLLSMGLRSSSDNGDDPSIAALFHEAMHALKHVKKVPQDFFVMYLEPRMYDNTVSIADVIDGNALYSGPLERNHFLQQKVSERLKKQYDCIKDYQNACGVNEEDKTDSDEVVADMVRGISYEKTFDEYHAGTSRERVLDFIEAEKNISSIIYYLTREKSDEHFLRELGDHFHERGALDCAKKCYEALNDASLQHRSR